MEKTHNVASIHDLTIITLDHSKLFVEFEATLIIEVKFTCTSHNQLLKLKYFKITGHGSSKEIALRDCVLNLSNGKQEVITEELYGKLADCYLDESGVNYFDYSNLKDTGMYDSFKGILKTTKWTASKLLDIN